MFWCADQRDGASPAAATAEGVKKISAQPNAGHETPDSTPLGMSGSSRDDAQARDTGEGVSLPARNRGRLIGPGNPPPRQLPAAVRTFVGRAEELGQLNAALSSEADADPGVPVYVIAGAAGTGKTSLAVHWAHQVRNHFPDGQLYASLHGCETGQSVGAHGTLQRFLTALGVDAGAVPQDPDAASALFRSLLADRRMLVILDNAATVGQVRPLLPASEHSLVLVTSRSRLSGLDVRDGARRMTLGGLPLAEAITLLRAVMTGHRPDNDAHKLADLARLCARLPLALRIAAERAVSQPHLPLDDLITDLRNESSLWDALSTREENEADAARSVFAWGYRPSSDEAARLFRLLGVHPGSEFGLHPAAALAGYTTQRTRQLLDSLASARLLEQTAPDRYRLHDQLRVYAVDQEQHERSDEEREAALLRVLHWYLHTADAAQTWLKPADEHVPLAPPPQDVRPLTFPDYHAAVDWAERERTTLLRAVQAAADSGHDELAWRLAAATWLAQSPSAHGADWPPVGLIGLEAAERLGDRAARGQLLTQLGMAYTRINRLADAHRCHEEALTIWREREDGINETRSLNLLGLVSLRLRRLNAAERRFKQAITGFREQAAAHWEATALSNLASTQYQAGHVREAEGTSQSALRAHRALNNRRGEGNILRLVSDIHREQGRKDEALTTARTAVDIALDLRDHRLEGYWLITLGDAQQAGAQLPEALTSYQRSATLHRRLGDQSREALAWQGAGQVYLALDRRTESTGFYRRAAVVHHALNDSWREALALDGLARALLADDAQTAHRHWQETLRLLADYEDPRAVAFREDVARQLRESE